MDDKVSISVMHRFLYVAEIIGVQPWKIWNIAIETLRQDTKYPGFELGKGTEHEDFVSLMNSFYPRSLYPNAMVDVNSDVCLLVIRRLKDD